MTQKQANDSIDFETKPYCVSCEYGGGMDGGMDVWCTNVNHSGVHGIYDSCRDYVKKDEWK